MNLHTLHLHPELVSPILYPSQLTVKVCFVYEDFSPAGLGFYCTFGFSSIVPPHPFLINGPFTFSPVIRLTGSGLPPTLIPAQAGFQDSIYF